MESYRLQRLYASLINKALFWAPLPLGVWIDHRLVGAGEWPSALKYAFGVYYGVLVVTQVWLRTFRYTDIGKLPFRLVIIPGSPSPFFGFVPNVLLRWVLNSALYIIVPFYGLADALMIFSAEQRCLHDRLAGTRVIPRAHRDG